MLEGAESEEELQDIETLMTFLGTGLESKTNFEYIQAILHVALQIHGDMIMQHESLRERAQKLHQQLSDSWSGVEHMLQRTQCIAEFYGSLHGSTM